MPIRPRPSEETARPWVPRVRVVNISRLYRATTVPRSRTSEHERLNGMGQAADFSGVAIQPEKIGNLLIGFVHHHHRHFSIRIDEGGRKQRTSARRAGDSPCARTDKL